MAETTPATEETPAAPVPKDVRLSAPEVAWLLLNAPNYTRQPGRLAEDDAAQLVAIVMRESGGRTGAVRDAADNTAGGNDLGLAQLNDKWNTFLADDPGARVAALDAFVNIVWMLNLATHNEFASSGYFKYEGGFDLSPWGGKNTSRHPATAQGYENKYPLSPSASDRAAVANPVDPKSKLENAGHHSDVYNWRQHYNSNSTVTVNDRTFVDDIVDSVAGWIEPLTRILGNLLSGEWWRRIAVGALGLAMVVAGLAVATAT